MRRLAALVLVALGPLAQAGAQKSERVPERPRLPPAADTNDANAYYDLAQSIIDRRPRRAADGFYWATRLNPYAASAFYGRQAALLMADPARIGRFLDRAGDADPPPDIARLDSLRTRALMLDPFLYRKFDHLVLRRYYESLVRRYSTADDMPMTAETNRAFARWVVKAGPATRAWVAYCEGRFADALREYAEAIETPAARTPTKADLYEERGHIFYLIDQPDSALAELGRALEELRKQDDKKLVRVYDSKAMLEHRIAKIHERMGDALAAREAYGRALQEDLAFHPAHVGLGMLALQEGDTGTALSELELSVQITGTEPMVRLFYGYLLMEAGRLADAEAQLTRAIELEPYYARSYQLLGGLYEKQQKHAQAILQYEAYLARAARTDPPREAIARHLEALKTAVGLPIR